MILVNKKNGKDVTKFALQYLQDQITKEEFERLSGLDPKTLKSVE